MYIKVNKSELVEVIISGAAGGNKQVNITFPDIPQLRGKLIDSIEVLITDDVSKSPTGLDLITSAQMKSGFLTLFISDPQKPGDMGEFVKNFPLSALHRVQSSANSIFVRALPLFPGLQVQFAKCQVLFGAPINNTDNVSILFNVYYRDK